MQKFEWSAERIAKFDAILARGLCTGVGTRTGQMCIEAAICAVFNLPHGDDPTCVTREIRAFKISLNDSLYWVSNQSRALGLRKLGIAQIGSKGVVNGKEFLLKLQEKLIRRLIPALYREVFPDNRRCLDAALRCELEGTRESANAAHVAAYAAAATSATAAASFAASAAACAYAYAASDAATNAVTNVTNATYAACAYAASIPEGEKYLVMSCDLALEVLIELKSPGCEWL